MSPITATRRTSASLLPEITSFLSTEADLLDEWRLNEWLALFGVEARYTVAPLQDVGDATPATALFLISDDYRRLKERVHHLLGGSAWTERPRSRTRRLVTNVRLLQSDKDISVKTNFVVYQFRNGESWEFVGTALYELLPREDGWSILRRSIRLDHESIERQRRISIIL